jgi:ribose 1,5-bisphosphokinase PhnN
MRELGYVEGKDYVSEWRSLDGKYERVPEIAAELVRLKVVIVTSTIAALPTLKRTITTLPIVMLTRPIRSVRPRYEPCASRRQHYGIGGFFR